MEIIKNKLIKAYERIKNDIHDMLELLPKPLIGVMLAILILLSPLFDNKIAWGHDYSFHATNYTLNSNQISFQNFHFFLPKIFGKEIANGFGYGTGIFYPPLSYYMTSYIASFLNFFNLDKNLSITCLEILILALSGIIMYIFLNRMFKDNKIAGIGSISYISSTYFLSDIYTRCALGELLTFIFIPIVFWGLYELFFENEKKFNFLFILGYTGMIHSHLVLSVYLTIIIIILFMCFPKKVFRKDKMIKLFISSIIILLLSCPYLVPLIEHKIYGKYVVFEPNSMYSIEWIKYNSLEIKDFIKIGTICLDGVKVYINHITLILSIIVITFNKKIFSKENSVLYKIIIIIVITSSFISSTYFPWEKMPSFLKMIQFPWRMCGITLFGLSLLIGNIIKIIKGENKLLIISAIAISIILFGFNSISQDRITNSHQNEYMSLGGQSEYLPTNTINSIDYFNNRNQDIIIKKGEAEITIIENNTPYLKSLIEMKSESIVIELPRLYYLGYSIKMTDDKNNIKKLKYTENENGFVQLEINNSGILEVSYQGTNANRIANYICLVTLLTCILTLIYKKHRQIGYKNQIVFKNR